MNTKVPFLTPRIFCLTALSAAIILASCKKEEPEPVVYEIAIELTEYTLDATGDLTAEVSFSASDDWDITVTEGENWLSAAPANGMAGSQTIELTATEIFEQTERTAYADIVCGDKTVQLTVIHAWIDYTSLFDPGFAYQLQVRDIISDAGNITREDMENIAVLTMLDIYPTSEEKMLTSIRGIEYFRLLTHQNCSSNKLTTIDLSKIQHL